MSVQIQRQIRAGLSDAYAFVRSQEANRAIQQVTFNQLLAEQLQRNGETERLNKASNNPYSLDPAKVEPASSVPLSRANFLSGTDTGNITKLDRIVYLKGAISDLVDRVKKLKPQDIEDPDLTDSPESGDLTIPPDDPRFVA